MFHEDWPNRSTRNSSKIITSSFRFTNFDLIPSYRYTKPRKSCKTATTKSNKKHFGSARPAQSSPWKMWKSPRPAQSVRKLNFTARASSGLFTCTNHNSRGRGVNFQPAWLSPPSRCILRPQNSFFARKLRFFQQGKNTMR